MEKGRFAPSPSGRMHLGNLMCSLLAWLSARASGGQVVLRIEDLDAARCPRTYADLLEQDLAWLGLVWDEGGSAGGPDGPYYQSERFEIYKQYYDKLNALGLVYPCFCSRSQLHAASAPHRADGQVVYPGTCRGRSPEEVARRALKKAPAWRVQVPDRVIGFTDGHLGHYEENLAADCGDFYLRRGDGVYAYQLAVVVDDALPLLLAPDGRRLSKRDGDVSLEQLATRYTPEQIVGRLAYACGLQTEPAPRTPAQLLPDFDWAKVPRQDICLPEGLF